MIEHARVIEDQANSRRLQKALGQFYTPEVLGRRLAASVVRHFDWRAVAAGSVISIADPFSGDGRLIAWLLDEIGRQDGSLGVLSWSVHLSDVDEAALDKAVAVVKEAASRNSLNVTVHCRHEDVLLSSPGFHDIVVTNPPWESVKPDRRELTHLGPEEAARYVKALKVYDQQLAAALPVSQPSRKFAGWGTNLSRCGLELSLRSTRSSGVVAVVLPFGLLGDQVSEPLRRWMLTEHCLVEAEYYPAEARTFHGVDQAVAVCTFVTGRPTSVTLAVRNTRQCGRLPSEELNLSTPATAKNGSRIPLDAPAKVSDVLLHLAELPQVRDLESRGPTGLWLGRELDESGWRDFVRTDGDVRFVKGRSIGRFIWRPDEAMRVSKVMAEPFASAGHTRIAWRDVARRSQKRRVQATVLPPNVVTGNSLHVAYFRDDNEDRLLALLGLMNSLLFELQVRVGLSTGHVSLGTVRAAHIPVLDESLVATLAPVVRRLREGDIQAEDELELLCARAYGLAAGTLDAVAEFFHTAEEVES